VLELRVRPDQADYVSPVQVTLLDAEQCPGSTPMAILCDETPMGFYRIELHAGSVADRDFEVPALGLRSFFLDQAWQGRGLARPALAALLADLPGRQPQARLLVLTVNCRNLAARALYLDAGFIDTGELYHGGRSGPQHLLTRSLP
jgi:RimJ/RimL family protein N-acetyltransferase